MAETLVPRKHGAGLAAMIHEVLKHGTSPQQSEELADTYDEMDSVLGFYTEYEDGALDFKIVYPQVTGDRMFKVTVEAL